MKSSKRVIRIDLTTAQKELIKKETGKDAESIELKADELEERIAPVRVF
ncbi:MAG: hypothetical protein ABJC19_04535 [Gemmatimonadota bacterium]